METGQAELDRLRIELDTIDAALLAAVHDRITCCISIAQVKRVHSIPMMQPQRVAFVHQRAQEFALENGISPAFLRRLYDLMIEETCRVEEEIIGDPARSASPG